VKALLIMLALAIPLRAHAQKGCHEVSHVAGYQHCAWFGDAWSRDAAAPPLWLDLTYYHHDFIGDSYSLDQSAARRAATEQPATTTIMPMLRLLYGRILYVGGEFSFPVGWMSGPHDAKGEPDSELEGHVVGGAHLLLWRLGAGAEVAAGGRVEIWCGNSTGRGCAPSNIETRRELQLRAHVDVFLSPQFSLGFMAGRSMIDAADTEYFVTLGIHMLPSDGAP
jgi:hypothetical protein